MTFPIMYIISVSIANIEFEYQSKICLALLQKKVGKKMEQKSPKQYILSSSRDLQVYTGN